MPHFALLGLLLALLANLPAWAAASDTAGTPLAQPAPVVRPHGPLHATRPAATRQPNMPLPLPPPLPGAEQATPPPAAAAPAPAAPTPAAAKPTEEQKPQGSGLPVPRFAALRTDDVNMRAGPGFRYPIEWVYKRHDLPVEIEREFEVWRLVQAPDGTRGWVHEATLTGRRTFIVQDKEATLRADAGDASAAVARLMPGVIGRIRSCDAGSAWCHVQVGDYRGYIARGQIWGVLPDEAVHP